MELKITIDDESFLDFTRKKGSKEKEPIEKICSIVELALAKSGLKAECEAPKKSYYDIVDFDQKIRKYKITQRAVARALNTRQGTISRVLADKPHKNSIYAEIVKNSNNIILKSYILQQIKRYDLVEECFRKHEDIAKLKPVQRLLLEFVFSVKIKRRVIAEELYCDHLRYLATNRIYKKVKYRTLEMSIESLNNLSEIIVDEDEINF